MACSMCHGTGFLPGTNYSCLACFKKPDEEKKSIANRANRRAEMGGKKGAIRQIKKASTDNEFSDKIKDSKTYWDSRQKMKQILENYNSAAKERRVNS